MSTVIYKEPYKRGASAIAHINDKGTIFSDPEKELGLACGHVGDGGRVYSHPTMKAGYCLGHVDVEGKIYDHPTSKIGHLVGYVNDEGVVFNAPGGNLGAEMGHVDGPYYKEAAVYYLLGICQGKQPDIIKVANIIGSAGGGGGGSTGNAEKSSSSASSSSSQKASAPAVDAGSGSTVFGVAFMIGLAIVFGLIDTIRELLLNYPAFILMFVYMVRVFINPYGAKKIEDFGLSEAEISAAKAEARSSLPKHLIIPVILSVYSVIKRQPFHASYLIIIIAPVISTLIIAYLLDYKKNLGAAKEAKAIKKKTANTKNNDVKKPKEKPVTDEKKVETKKAAVTQQKQEVPPERVVVQCEKCSAKLRVPMGKGMIKAKCPKCHTENIFNT